MEPRISYGPRRSPGRRVMTPERAWWAHRRSSAGGGQQSHMRFALTAIHMLASLHRLARCCMAELPARKLGPEGRKLDPKLRMVANGSSKVNAVRAEQCAAVSLPKGSPLLDEIPRQLDDDARPVERRSLPRHIERGRLEAIPADVLANVFITTTDADEETAGFPGETTRRGNMVAATVPLASLKEVASRDRVLYVELGQRLVSPRPTVASGRVGAPPLSQRRFGDAKKHRGGDKVLIGIVDVEGFDFAHADFLDAQGQTRWVRIWDQGGDARP